jgi:GNAT superfamily N-acetyltransferase
LNLAASIFASSGVVGVELFDMPRVLTRRRVSPMPHDRIGPRDEAIALKLRALRTRIRHEALVVAALEEGVIDLDLLKVEPELRGKGIGTRIMLEVLDIADRFGVPIRLQPYSLAENGGGLDQDSLEAWYRSFGFVMTGRVSPTGQPIMSRAPALSPVRRRRASHRRFREAAL